MLDWHLCQIFYPLEIKLLLLILYLISGFPEISVLMIALLQDSAVKYIALTLRK